MQGEELCVTPAPEMAPEMSAVTFVAVAKLDVFVIVALTVTGVPVVACRVNRDGLTESFACVGVTTLREAPTRAVFDPWTWTDCAE